MKYKEKIDKFKNLIKKIELKLNFVKLTSVYR